MAEPSRPALAEEQLIDRLVAGAASCRPLLAPGLLTGLWLLAAALAALLPLLVHGLRPDWLEVIADGRLYVLALPPLALAAAAAYVGLATAVPARPMPQVARFLPGVLLVVLGLTLTLLADHRAAALGRGWSLSTGWSCSSLVGLLALAPALSLAYLLRRRAPLRPVGTGVLVGIAAGALGCLGASLHCPSDALGHVLMYHALPVLVTAWLGSRLGPYLLRW